MAFYCSDFEEFTKSNKVKYNLIVSNPPYFMEDKNRLSSNNQRNICRFLKSVFVNFLNFVYNHLDTGGVALF